jgi:hypothetical protein
VSGRVADDGVGAGAQRGEKVWILDFQYDKVLHWVTGYCEARPDHVGNIALQSVSIHDTAYTRLLARLAH